jgi:hypothetical protein
MSVINDQMLSPDGIVTTLANLPGDLYKSDVLLAELDAKQSDLQESLEITEVNVSLNANCDGKNAEARELQRKQALAASEDVQSARKQVSILKADIEIEKANNKMLSRQFAGTCHIAELRAAQMILQAKGVTK